jgi:hypothetical protein
MKRFLSILSVALLATAISCSQSNDNKNKEAAAEIKFAESEHDFGNIEQGSKAEFAFTFTNIGKDTLVINNVHTSCGCTVPDWTREPVMKKKSGVVTVSYNTHALGNFNKTITVYSNASNSQVTLIIKGTVVPKPESPEKK